MIKNIKNRIVLFGAILFTLVGCHSDYIYSSTLDVESPWRFEKGQKFDFEIQDTLAQYDLILSLNHDDDYKFQNLYTKISMIYPDKTIVDDIVSLELSTRAGLWDAKCSGGDCDLEILLQKSAHFPQVGTYSFNVNQNSRDSLLTGINAIGLSVQIAK